MIKIASANYLKDYKIEVSFSDGATKIFDYAQIFGFKGITEKFRDLFFFKSFKIQDNGFSIGWEENGEIIFDNCPTAMRYYWKDESNEWDGFDDSVGLQERKKIANSRKIAS
jgi:hypothetical protein